MKGSLLMLCSRKCGTEIYQKRTQDQIIAFMMAWHPRLGQDAQISNYVPKAVAKEIIAEQLRQRCNTFLAKYQDQEDMPVRVSIHDVRFRLDYLCDSDDNDRFMRILYPPMVSANRFNVQSPYLTTNVDVNDAISFEEHLEFTELMNSIVNKIADIYPLASWPGCSHAFKLDDYPLCFKSGKYIGTVRTNPLKKGTKVRAIFQYVYLYAHNIFEWRVSQLEIQ